MSILRVALPALIVLRVASMVPAAQSQTIVFEHVNLISMDRTPASAVTADSTVLIQNGTVSVVGTGNSLSAKIPDGALRVDGRGKFLMPALAEMHAHIPNDPADAERVLFMYVANGIGTIRSMLGDPGHFRLRERVMRGEIVGPNMLLSGPSFNGQTAARPTAAVARVAEQVKAGYDFLKIHPGIPLDAFNALAAAADKAPIRFAGHVPQAVGLQRALQAKFSTIDHLDGYVEALARPGAPASQNFGVNLMAHIDDSRIDALAKQTAAAGVANVPTQILLENWYGSDSVEAMLKRPELQYARPAEIAQWASTKRDNDAAVSGKDRARFIAVRRRLIKAIQDAGGLLLLGSDAPQVWNVPGFSIHRELASYVDSGLTPYQALATGTRNVARHVGASEPRFTKTARTRTNVVLLDANPLENIANTTRIAGVMVGGRWIPKAEIDKRLAGMRNR
jgi:imidazolonepropionase-like amidohydrolase